MQFIQNYNSRFRILKGGKISLVVSALLGSAIIASASPTAGVVTSGTATISQNGNTTNINQTTSKASINWQNFNIASNETVNFNQPNKNSITLNRVIGNEKSVIDGALNANGQVWILNSNGILFSKDAKINTSGLVATTAELSDKDFQDGNYNFKNSKSNSVVNLGTIEVSEGGYVVLASNEVRNSGTIKAIKGKVFLSGNSEYTINLNGNSIVNLIVTKGILDSMVENSGTIVANGGEIYLTTNAVNELLKGVVNNTGILEANSLDELTGKVEVFAHGGTANVSGTINAEGGFVETSGKNVKIADGTKIKAKEWLIDPLNFTITSGTGSQTSSSIGATTLSNNLATTSVVIQTTNGSGSENGDIFVNSAISWSSDKSLTLNAYRNIYINSDITATNASGKLSLYYGQGAVASGNTASYTIGKGKKIDLQAGQNFSTKLGSNGTVLNYTVITSLGNSTDTNTGTSLQGMKSGNTSVLYALGSNIDASATSSWNETSVGSGVYQGFNTIAQFYGNLAGLGHTIDGLYINRPAVAQVGLFGTTINGNIISDLGVTNANIKGGHTVGILIGYLYSASVNNVWTSGVVEGTSTNGFSQYGVGGLAGRGRSSIIYNSYSTATVKSTATSGSYVGGLMGYLESSGIDSKIYDSYASGTILGGSSSYVGGLIGYIMDDGTVTCEIDRSYASGNVSSTGNFVGGLIGAESNAKITDVYATGNVSGGSNVGGLIGHSYVNLTSFPTSKVTNAYSTGSVTGTTNVGGLVGNNAGIFLNSFWDTQTSGKSNGVGTGSSTGITGKTTAEMKTNSTYTNAGWDFTTVWGIKSGGIVNNGYPVLRALTTVDVPITITLTGNLTKTYGDTNPTISYTSSDNSAVTIDWGSAMTQWTNAGTYAFSSTANIFAPVYTTGTASDYVITWDYGSYGITVNPYTLSLSNFAASNKIYNGTNAASVSGTLGTALNGDTVNLTGTFVDKNVANGKIVTAALSNANYTLGATPITTTANITPKTITISGLTSSNKVYDGLTSTTLNGTAALQSETAGTGTSSDGNTYTGDTVNLIGTATGTFDNKNVATGKTVNITGLTLDGIDSGNYTLSGATTTADITAKAITFSAPDVTKTYDGGLTYTATAGELTTVGSSLISGDTLTSITLAYADKNAGTDNKTVNASSAVINDGNNGNNYSVTYTSNNTSTITPKTVSLSASKTYDGTTDLTNFVTINTGITGEALTYTGATVNDKHVTTANKYINAITLANGVGGTASNYVLPTLNNTNAAVTINAATLTPTISNTNVTKEYNGNTDAPNTFTPTYTFGGLVSGDTLATLSNTGFEYNSKDVASANKITVSGLAILGITGTNSSAISDYVLDTTTKDVNASITAKALTVNGLTANNKTYDGTTSVSISNWGAVTTGVGSETLVLNHGTASFGSANANETTPTTVTANNYSLANGTGVASNYSLTSTNASTTATISKAALTMTANNDSAVYTDVIPTLSAKYSGFVNGENASSLSGVNITTTATNSSNAGTYTITPTATSSNYALTFINGVFTVVPADTLLVRINNASTVYGTTPTFSVDSAKYYKSGTGIVTLSSSNTGNDYTLTDNGSTAATFSLSSNGVNVGNYDITGVNFVKSTNNFVTNVFDDGNLSITPKALTVSASGANKIYDGTTNASNVILSVSGKVGSDDVKAVGSNGYFSSKDKATGLFYTIAGATLDGVDKNNYYIDTTGGTTFSANDGEISAKVLTISGLVANNKTYDGTTSVVISNWGNVTTGVGNETLVLNHGTASFGSANAGTQTATAIGYSLSNGTNGGLASNYALSSTSATNNATINEKAVVVTLPNSSTSTGTFGTAIVLPTPISNDVNAPISVKVFDSNHNDVTAQATAGTLGAGTYTIKPVGTSSNYSISDVSSTLTIDAKTVIATPSVSSITAKFGQSIELPTYSFSDNSVTAQVKVFDRNGNDVTIDANAKRLQPGQYFIRAISNDSNYLLTNNETSLVISAANQKINISSITNVPVVNSTMPTTQAQIHLPVKPSVNLSQNVMQDNSNNLTVPNIVSTPMESEATKMVTLSEVKSIQTTTVNETQSDDKNEIKVALSAYSGIKLVNGGVNLPLGVEQLFYVTEDKRK